MKTWSFKNDHDEGAYGVTVSNKGRDTVLLHVEDQTNGCRIELTVKQAEHFARLILAASVFCQPPSDS